MSNTYGIIILAAGSSDRLGKPKQLLLYKNETLLQHLIDEAKKSEANDVIVVLGANSDIIQTELQTGNSIVAINNNWEEGMASSIRCGINELQKINPHITAAILMVCDQPFVTAALLNDLIITHQQTNKLIITSRYDNTTGPPALFHKNIFSELLKLAGDAGARSIVQKYANEVVAVSFPKGDIDIDTDADYAALFSNSQ